MPSARARSRSRALAACIVSRFASISRVMARNAASRNAAGMVRSRRLASRALCAACSMVWVAMSASGQLAAALGGGGDRFGDHGMQVR